MKKLFLFAGLLVALGIAGARAAETSAQAAPIRAATEADAAALRAARQQLQDINQRRADAIAKLPGMKELEAQAADLTARLRAVAEARRALLAKHQQALAALDAEADRLRATLSRRELPPLTEAELQQKLAALVSQVATNQVRPPAP